MKTLKTLILSFVSLFISQSALAQSSVATCPNYSADQNGEAICKVDVRSGETIFYWDADRDGHNEKIKHAFFFTTADGRTIRFASFVTLDLRGNLLSQSWTTENSQDEWLYTAKNFNGMGFFEYFCQYKGGTCHPVTTCDLDAAKIHHDNMYKFFQQSNQSALQLAYATEVYTLADRWLNYCKHISAR